MRKLFLLVSFILLISTFALAQADAGFLEYPPDGSDPGWYCIDAQGAYTARLPEPQWQWTLPHARQWCQDNGFGW